MSVSVRKLSALDSAFLFMETTECPMHVGSMTVVRLPDGYTSDFYEDLKRIFESRMHLAKSLTYKLAPTPFEIDRPSWVEDEDFNIVRHVMRAAVPAPGDRLTLQRLAGWLHAKPLNRARPLWEVYVFDGLPNNEAAIYSKVHHSLIDGGAGAALTEILYDITPIPRKTSAPPPQADGAAGKRQDVRDLASSMVSAYTELVTAPFRKGGPSGDALTLPRTGGNDLGSVLMDAAIHGVEWPMRVAAAMPTVLDAFGKMLENALKPGALEAFAALSAPSTPLNVSVSSERSFASVSLPLGRVKAVAAAAGGKVNDVVLALSSAILRRYLCEIDALPNKSMTAFVPISAREAGDAELKNQVFGMVTTLATNEPSVRERLERIIAGATASKAMANPFRALAPHLAEIPTFGTPILFQLMMLLSSRMKTADRMPPQVNIVISNVVFSKRPFYIAGAELMHVYPMSIAVHGQGLNITVHGYRDNLDFGLIGASNVLPHIEHLGAMLPAALAELEEAYSIAPQQAAPAAVPPPRRPVRRTRKSLKPASSR